MKRQTIAALLALIGMFLLAFIVDQSLPSSVIFAAGATYIVVWWLDEWAFVHRGGVGGNKTNLLPKNLSAQTTALAVLFFWPVFYLLMRYI